MLHEAIVLASTSHFGQADKAGVPYIFHPLRVMEAVRVAGGTDQQIVAGVLHDVVEDTRNTSREVTVAHIENEFGTEVALLVRALTRNKGEKYFDFIDRVTRTPGAALVKRCDALDNLSRNHQLPPDEAERLRNRYERVLKILEGK